MAKTKYKIIFTLGYNDDEKSLMEGERGDVLILDEDGNYFDPVFITLARIESEFWKERVCYLEDKMVILHSVTKENILKSIPEIHNWLFKKRWFPLEDEIIEKYYMPMADWVFFDVEIS